MTDADEAVRLNSLGNELSDEGRVADAEGAYRAAAEAAPDWSVPWYNLGLLCKYQLRWQECLEYNRKATRLQPDDQGAWWNLGIAATAVGAWTEARRAWSVCGIELPPGDDAPEADFGLTPIRLDPDGNGEVVWAHRIDPARARLASIPLPASEYRWNDLVLHDGAAEGFRVLHGQEVPVFNALQRLATSGSRTFVVQLGTSDPDIVEALSDIAYEHGGAAEDWGTTTNILCRECSLGLPHEHADESSVPAHPHCGVAARDRQHCDAILRAWMDSTPGADVVDVTDATPPAGDATLS